jgi:hypothetical protein
MNSVTVAWSFRRTVVVAAALGLSGLLAACAELEPPQHGFSVAQPTTPEGEQDPVQVPDLREVANETGSSAAAGVAPSVDPRATPADADVAGVPDAWVAPPAVTGAPSAPVIAMAMALPTADAVQIWWLPAQDDHSPHTDLAYDVHVVEGRDAQPSASTARAAVAGETTAVVEGIRPGDKVWLTVTATDGDGQRGVWDEPIAVRVPLEPVRFRDDVNVLDLSGRPGVRSQPGVAWLPRADFATAPEQGTVLAFDVRQAPNHAGALGRVLHARAEGDAWRVTTESVVPEELVDGEIEPSVRFFDVPDALATPWEPDIEDGWERREAVVANETIRIVERRRAPTRTQKACVGNWWDCVESAVPSGQRCVSGTAADIGTASFSGGALRFAFACHFDSGSAPASSCDIDSPSNPTFDAFGQDDNGRYCLAGDAHFALQGQFGIGGEAVFNWRGKAVREPIGAGLAECDFDGTNLFLEDCEDDELRARAESGQDESDLAATTASLDLRPRVLGGVDVSVRGDGAAGIGVSYEFYDVYRVVRPVWFIWITLGSTAVADASIEAGGTMEAGFHSDFGNNVGLDINVSYDGSRSGTASSPYVFSREAPNSFGPSLRPVFRPSFNQRLSGSARATGIGQVAVYVYARLQSTVYFEIGPRAKLELNLGVGTPINGMPLDCGGSFPRLNQFDLDFAVGPEAKFEIQWPGSGSPISLGGSTASWAWPLGDPFWSSWTFQRRLLTLPRWSVSQTLPRPATGLAASICPETPGTICIEAARQDIPFRVNWSSVDWTFPSFITTNGNPDGRACVEVFAPSSAAGQSQRMRVQIQPVGLGAIGGMCGEAFYSVGTRALGCRWEGDGVCDFPLEDCGTADCPMGGPQCPCGDGICDNERGDNCGTCAADCGACAAPVTTQPANFVLIETPDPLQHRWNSWDNAGQINVTLPHDFYIQTTEVTQQQFFDRAAALFVPYGYSSYATFAACRADCNSTRSVCPLGCPSGHDQPGTLNPCPTCPVNNLTLIDAMLYANALSTFEGIPECYRFAPDPLSGLPMPQGVNAPGGDVTRCVGYRLPTEAEWEYAYRYDPSRPVGSRLSYTDLHDGTNLSLVVPPTLTSIAWMQDSFSSLARQAMPVGGLAANPAGLFDMSGNVWEWTWTSFDPATPFSIAATNPGARSPATWEYDRIVKGGSYVSEPQWTLAGAREGFFLNTERRDVVSWNLGFRVVRTRW